MIDLISIKISQLALE